MAEFLEQQGGHAGYLEPLVAGLCEIDKENDMIKKRRTRPIPDWSPKRRQQHTVDRSKYPIVHIDNDMISNVIAGKRTPPAGKPWEFYLFVKRQMKTGQVSDVVTLTAPTKSKLEQMLVDFVEKCGLSHVFDDEARDPCTPTAGEGE